MSSIAAIATPSAPSALGIIRCSGPLSATIFPDLKPRVATLKNYYAISSPLPPCPPSSRMWGTAFVPKPVPQGGENKIGASAAAPRGTTIPDVDGTLLDQVVATFYEEKKSFTGEASLELTAHGNPFILQKILADLLARGFVLAEPGEFTRRAFMNGRIDLTQAEAIGNLIAARSDRALAAAHRQLAGELGDSIRKFSDELLDLIAQIEATIDFPEEDVPLQLPPAEKLEALTEKLSYLRSTQRAHQLTFEGARVALVGAPNAGKSSLFNVLLGRDRALVSPIAGTTRDYIEAQINLGGHLVTLVDTAGLSEIGSPSPNPMIAANHRENIEDREAGSHEQIEAAGIKKTKEQLATADIILFVIDGTDPNGFSQITLEQIGSRPFAALIVATKCDLPSFQLPTIPPRGIVEYVTPATPVIISISAKTENGLDLLREAITVHLNALMPGADTLMVSVRHGLALDECLEQLTLAKGLLVKKSDPTLVAHHCHSALNYLGEILGRFDNEQVLDKLFHQFCIGK